MEVLMITASFGIFLAFWLLWIKLPLLIRLKALGYPFMLDLVASVGVFVMFGGTGEGALAATFAAVIMSINISVARYWFGYLGKKKGIPGYYVGKINMHDKIVQARRCQTP
jgi:hypothetical protein